MGLSYYYRFSAPITVGAAVLEEFLKRVEIDAKAMGFHPTAILNIQFDTPERKQFARRLTSGYFMADDQLKGVTFLDENMVWDYAADSGTCRLTPQKAVVMVITDDRGREGIFGFLAYPKELVNIAGSILLKTPIADRWFFEDWVKTPDPRFRTIVKQFAEAGYLEAEKDDYGEE